MNKNDNQEEKQKQSDDNNTDDEEEIESQLDEAELIEKTGEIISRNSKHLIHCLTIIGQVEGHYVLSSQNKTTKYEHIIPSLVAIEQDRSIEGLVIILNTVGGDVEAGLAIAELIFSIDLLRFLSIFNDVLVPLKLCSWGLGKSVGISRTGASTSYNCFQNCPSSSEFCPSTHSL